MRASSIGSDAGSDDGMAAFQTTDGGALGLSAADTEESWLRSEMEMIEVNGRKYCNAKNSLADK